MDIPFQKGSFNKVFPSLCICIFICVYIYLHNKFWRTSKSIRSSRAKKKKKKNFVINPFYVRDFTKLVTIKMSKYLL